MKGKRRSAGAPRRRRGEAWLLLTLSVVAGGCGAPYTIRGRVVEGDYSFIDFVPPDDARLSGPGVASAEVIVHRDADKPNAREVARGRTDGQGVLAIPLSEFGAGWMIEQWRIEAQRGGYQSVDSLLRLPEAKADRRLLIVMVSGYTPPPSENPWDQYRRLK